MPPPFTFPLKTYDIFFVGVAWGIAAHYGFSPGWLALALAVTAVVVVAIMRRLVRMRRLLAQLKTPDPAD